MHMQTFTYVFSTVQPHYRRIVKTRNKSSYSHRVVVIVGVGVGRERCINAFEISACLVLGRFQIG